MTNTYPRGQTVILTFAFLDDELAPFTPDTVSVQVLNPAKVVSVYDIDDLTPVLDEDEVVVVGEYDLDIVPNVSGRWHYRASTTGDAVTSAWASFLVPDDPFDDPGVTGP